MLRNLEEQVLYLTKVVEQIQQVLGNALPDPIPGPQGDPGEQGVKGEPGPQGFGIVGFGTQLPSSGRDGDWFLLKKSTMSGIDFVMCRCVLQHWVEQFSIRGPAGPIANATEVVANPETSPSDSLTKIKVDGVTYAVSEVEANPDSSYDHLGLTTAAINGITYYVGGVWAKYLSDLLYEDDGSVTCDGQFVATNSILVDSIASTVDQHTPVTISAITTTNEVTVGDDLTVGVNASVNNDLDVGNDLTVYGEIMVTDASSIVDENGDPLISGAVSNMVTTDTDQIITGIKTFNNGLNSNSDISINGNLEMLGGDFSCDGDATVPEVKLYKSSGSQGDTKLSVITTDYGAKTVLHDLSGVYTDTPMTRLFDGHRIRMYSIDWTFQQNAGYAYTAGHLHFQLITSKALPSTSGMTPQELRAWITNNINNANFRFIPATWEYVDNGTTKYVSGVIVKEDGLNNKYIFNYYDTLTNRYEFINFEKADITAIALTYAAEQ